MIREPSFLIWAVKNNTKVSQYSNEQIARLVRKLTKTVLDCQPNEWNMKSPIEHGITVLSDKDIKKEAK